MGQPRTQIRYGSEGFLEVDIPQLETL